MLSAHLRMVHLFCWECGTSFKGTQACLVSLPNNLTLSLSIYNSSKRWLSFLTTGFRNITQNQCHGVCWSGLLSCNLFNGLYFANLFIVLFAMLLLFRTVVPHCQLCILSNFWVTFSCRGNCRYHHLFRCRNFFKEFSIGEMWPCLSEWPSITINLPFSTTIVLETLVESWSCYSMLMKPWASKQELVGSLRVNYIEDWGCL